MKPQLARSTNVVEPYLSSENWGMQQKVDGVRTILECDLSVSGLNRRGDPIEVPENVSEALSGVSGWTFDGEMLKDVYYIFDLLAVPSGPITHWPLIKRYELLNKLTPKLKEPIHLLPLWIEDKTIRLSELRKSRAEGVIFKRLNAEYIGGKTAFFLKHKFINELDCVVLAKNVNDKENISLGVWDGKDFIEVGKCSALVGDGPSLEINDVVTISCLYVTNSNRLFHATLPRLRNDKLPEECSIGQLDECRVNKLVAI